MTAKLIYLLMDYETFNQLLALELVRGLFRALKLSTMKLFAHLKLLTFLAKTSNLDTCLGPECDSAGGHKAVLKIQTERSL